MAKKKRARKSSSTDDLLALDDAALLLEVRRRNLLPAPTATPYVAPRASVIPTIKKPECNNTSGGGTPCWWSTDEDERLTCAVGMYGLRRIHGVSAWPTIAKAVATRTDVQCRRRWDYIRDKKVPGVYVSPAPPPVAEVTKVVDVNSFFDQQLAEPDPATRIDEDQVEHHYGLLALEAFDDSDPKQVPATTTSKKTEVIGARRSLYFAFDTHPLGDAADLFVSERQRYEAHLRERQAQVTRSELHRRLALERAANLETIAFA